jgi:Amt family ammonium transporter
MKIRVLLVMMMALMLPHMSYASDAGTINSGDTAWMLISTALVTLMTPGLALFYGGMVRRKNVLGTIMHSFIMLFMVSVIWVLWGYTLAFGPDKGGIIGGPEWFGLNGVGQEPSSFAPTVPHLLFMMFQGTFAVITPALITGAFAERMKFSALIFFTILWVTFVYSPLCHWVWGGGWMAKTLGTLDFAGGIVVHISSAVAALAAIIVIGKRRGYGKEPMLPHDLPMTILGLALLWFGWFGFNAGSALTSGGLASVAFVTTNTAAGAAAMSWMVIEWLQRGKPTALGAMSGAVAGLAGITPAAGFVSPLSSIVIGIIAGLLCYVGVNMKSKFGYDDSLDVIGIHGVSGTWGTLAVGLFASAAINPAGKDGLFHGNSSLFVTQGISVIVSFVFVFAATFIILKLVDWIVGLRVKDGEEFLGLDQSLHGESAYTQ